MTLAETIYQRSLKLPEAAAREALDFIEFLEQRYGTQPTQAGESVAAHEAWFRGEVQRALDDPRPAVPDAQVQVHFAARRAVLSGQRDT